MKTDIEQKSAIYDLFINLTQGKDMKYIKLCDNKKKAVFAVLLFLIFLVTALFIFIWIPFYSADYRTFDDSRTAEMEEMFGLELGETELKKYKIGNYGYTLQIDSIQDYHMFMENNLSGAESEIYKLEENGVIYDYENNEQKKCSEENYTARYYYTFRCGEYVKWCTISFYEENNGQYSAEVFRSLV